MIRQYHRYRVGRRWLVVLALLACVAVHAVIIGHFLLSPEQFRIRTQQMLQSHLRGEVTLGEASYEFPLGFALKQIRVARAAERGGGELFRAEALTVELSMLQLLRGRLAVDDLVLEEPELFLATQDLAEAREPRPAMPRAAVGRVILRNGRIHLGKDLFFAGSPERELHDVNLELSLARRLANGYELEGEAQSDLWGRCDLDGTLDLGARRLNATVRARGVAIDARLREQLPQEYTRVLDRYNPQGVVDLTVEPDISWAKGVQVALRGAADLRDCRIAWERFPVPLTEIRGKVVLDGTNVYYRDIAARAGPATVTLWGQTTREKIDFHLICRGRPVDKELYDAAPDNLKRVWDRCGVEGGTVNVDYNSTWWRTTRTYESAIRVEIRDGRATYRTFPYPLSDLAGTIRWEKGMTHVDSLTGRRGNARVSVKGQVTDAGAPDLLIEALDLPFDEALRKAATPGWRKVLDELNPQGAAAVECRITAKDGDPSVLQYRTQIRPEGASFRYGKFPHTFTGVRGDILVDEAGTISFRALGGKLEKIPVTFLGGVSPGPKGPLLDMQVVAPEVELGPVARSLLSKPAGAVYDQLDPHGKVSVSWHVTTDPDTGEPRQATEMRCIQDCSIQARHFPVLITGLLGQLTAEDTGRTVFTGMRGRIGNAVAEAVTGRFLPGPKGGLDFTIKVTGLTVDDSIRKALPQGWQKVWDDLQPSGEADGEYHYASNPDTPDKAIQRLTIVPVNGAIRYRKFPLPIGDITRGKVVFDQDGNATISNVQGKVRGKAVQLAGKITASEKKTEMRLEAVADELTLDDELKGALPPEWQKVWEGLQLGGRIGASAAGVIDLKKGEWESFELDATLKGCEATYSKLPARLTGLRGRVEYDDGVITLTDVVGNARHADQVWLSGRVSKKPGSGERLEVRVQNLQFDPEFRAILPPDARKAAEDMAFQGIVDADLTLLWPAEAPGATQVFGLIRLRDGSLDRLHRFREVNGNIRIDRGLLGADGAQDFKGTMDLRRLKFRDLVATDVRGAFSFARPAAEKDKAPPPPTLLLQDIVGSFYGGRLNAKFDIVLDKTPGARDEPQGRMPHSASGPLQAAGFAGRVGVNGTDFRLFTKEALGVDNPATGSLNISLVFPPERYKDEKGLIGDGRTSIENGELGQLPFTVSLFNAIGLRSPTDLSISKAEMWFGIGQAELAVKRLMLSGESRLMVGDGTIGYDGALKLRLVSPRSGGIPVIGPLIQNQLVQIDVRGNVSKPEYRVLPVPVVPELFEEFMDVLGIWKKSREEK